MKGFGSRSRRSGGARPLKTRPSVATRPPDAALGRGTRGLVGPARGGSSSTGRSGSGRAKLRRPGFGPLRALGRIVTPARAGGLLGMLAAGFLFTLATGPTAFGLARTDLPALTWTDPQAVTETLDVPAGGNVFRLDTAPLEAALRTLPTVATAEVSVSLPDAALVVEIVERVPILAWQVGDIRYVADRDGMVFATTGNEASLPAGVAIIEDRRVQAATPAIGGHLDAVDLDVATRLGSLTAADLGSRSSMLRVAITDSDGFIVNAPGSWTAVFGFYSPATRATDMIPGQVRLLRSLLAGREDAFARIILASENDGTYVPRNTPKPTPR